MQFFWNREEVFCGNSMEKYTRVCNLLAQNGIAYTTRYKNNRNVYPFGSAWKKQGSFGLNTDLTALFYIYVNTEDSQQAHYLANKAIET